MMRFGLRAHDFGKLPLTVLADTLCAYEPASIQLALAKALSDTPSFPGALSPGYARRLGEAFARKHIDIAILGCYINPIHPDPEAREAGLKRFEEHLRFVRDMGCAVVGTETGSCNADCSYHPDTDSPAAFDSLIKSLERLVRTAERFGAIVGIEAVAHQHTLSSIPKLVEALRRIDSPNLQVIYDPVNLLPPQGLPEVDGTMMAVPSVEAQRKFFCDAFDRFGDRIVAVHLKDFRYDHARKIGDLPALTGNLDTQGLLNMLAQHKPFVDILLENSDPSSARATLATLRGMSDAP
jgi:sugar phosphate isomerase/epimerase